MKFEGVACGRAWKAARLEPRNLPESYPERSLRLAKIRKSLFIWRSQPDSNRCTSLERVLGMRVAACATRAGLRPAPTRF
jgi:hypothetical protein